MVVWIHQLSKHQLNRLDSSGDFRLQILNIHMRRPQLCATLSVSLPWHSGWLTWFQAEKTGTTLPWPPPFHTPPWPFPASAGPHPAHRDLGVLGASEPSEASTRNCALSEIFHNRVFHEISDKTSFYNIFHFMTDACPAWPDRVEIFGLKPCSCGHVCRWAQASRLVLRAKYNEET